MTRKVFDGLCLMLLTVCCAEAFPKSKYFPRSYMVGGSFYANPRYVRDDTAGYEYFPPGQMTAMVVGDAVATNSFSGPPQTVVSIPIVGQVEDKVESLTEKQPVFAPGPDPDDSINETEPEEDSDQPDDENLFALDEATTQVAITTTTTKRPVASKAPARKIKVGKARRPTKSTTTVAPQTADEEEEEDDEASVSSAWPFGAPGKGGPGYNAFFPIFIGGQTGRSRSRNQGYEESVPGAATAIANSFSTGKGGVATSHATAFGDPYAASVLRNTGYYNFKTKSTRKEAVSEE